MKTIKITLTLLLMSLLATSCNKYHVTSELFSVQDTDFSLSVIQIDMGYGYMYYVSLSHKGVLCRKESNPIDKYILTYYSSSGVSKELSSSDGCFNFIESSAIKDIFKVLIQNANQKSTFKIDFSNNPYLVGWIKISDKPSISGISFRSGSYQMASSTVSSEINVSAVWTSVPNFLRWGVAVFDENGQLKSKKLVNGNASSFSEIIDISTPYKLLTIDKQYYLAYNNDYHFQAVLETQDGVLIPVGASWTVGKVYNRKPGIRISGVTVGSTSSVTGNYDRSTDYTVTCVPDGMLFIDNCYYLYLSGWACEGDKDSIKLYGDSVESKISLIVYWNSSVASHNSYSTVEIEAGGKTIRNNYLRIYNNKGYISMSVVSSVSNALQQDADDNLVCATNNIN